MKTTAAKWTKSLEVWILARLKLFHRGQRPHPWRNLRTQPWDVRIYCREALACLLLDSRVRYVTKKRIHGRLPRVTHWCPPRKGLAAAASLETLGKCVPYHCTNSCCSWFDKGITWTCHGSFQEKELTWMRWFDFWDWSQAWFHRDIRWL